MPIKILAHNGSYSSSNVVYDSEDDDTWAGGALIKGSLSINPKEDQSTEAKFSFSRVLSKIIQKRTIIEIYVSQDENTYSTNLQFYGFIDSVDVNRTQVDVTAKGFTSALVGSVIELTDESNLDGYTFPQAFSELFEDSDAVQYLRDNDFPFEVDFTMKTNKTFKNIEDSSLAPIRYDTPVARVEPFKELLKRCYDYEPGEPFPLYYHSVEQGHSIRLVREEYNVATPVLTLQARTAPLVGAMEWTSTRKDNVYNCVTVHSKDYDDAVISWETDAPTNELPFRYIEQIERLKSTDALKQYAEQLVKSFNEDRYEVRATVSDGWSLKIGDMVRCIDGGRDRTLYIREMIKRIGNTEILMGESEEDFAKLL